MDRCIGCQDTGSPGISDNSHAVIRGQGLIGHGDGDIEHFFNIITADDPGLFKSRIYDFITAGQRTGMGSSRRCAFHCASGFECQYWFGAFGNDLAGGFHQSRSVTDLFQIDQNHLCFRIISQVVKQVNFTNIGFVAKTDKF